MNTFDTLIKQLRDDREQEAKMIDLHERIAGVLRERFQGKPLNARIEKLVASVVPGHYTVVYMPTNSSVTLQLWHGVGGNGRDKHTFWLGHKQDLACYDVARFEASDACNGSAAKIRNAKRDALLADVTPVFAVSVLVERLKADWAALRALDDDMDNPVSEVTGHARRLTGLDTRRN